MLYCEVGLLVVANVDFGAAEFDGAAVGYEFNVLILV